MRGESVYYPRLCSEARNLLYSDPVKYLLSLVLFLLMVVVSSQTQGNQLPGVWVCKDKNGEKVFTNRTWDYGECRPYVASPGLREAFLQEMLLLQKKQHAPQQVVPDQPNIKSNVIGPL